MDTAATPPCFGYYTRLLLQAVADSRLILHPANLLHTSGWNKQTKPRDLHQPAFHSTTARTPLLHSSPSTSPLIWNTRTTYSTSQTMFAIRSLQNKAYKHSNTFDLSGHKHIPVIPSSPSNSYKTKHPPIPNCFYTHALRAFPITLISDPPSCHSTCLILQGLQTQAFFRVLDCLCAERGRELHLLRL